MANVSVQGGPSKHSRWRAVGIGVLALALLLLSGRAALPWFVRDYVNRTVDPNKPADGETQTGAGGPWLQTVPRFNFEAPQPSEPVSSAETS